MSLVYTLASRNLLQDRLRFIASLTGIVFSVVLVMVQLGLYFGFNRMLTMIIDHAATDLWVVSAETKYFEDLSLLDSKMRERLLAIDGVAQAAPVLTGFSVWMLPKGGMTSVFMMASDLASGGLPVWNKVDGDPRSLLEAPARQIAENSAVDGGVVVARMLSGKGSEGFDAGRKEYVDLIEAGIIDPTKVVRIALENAVSVASLLLLTEATMTEIPEDRKERAAEPEMAL